jgi:hypothetical protein
MKRIFENTMKAVEEKIIEDMNENNNEREE